MAHNRSPHETGPSRIRWSKIACGVESAVYYFIWEAYLVVGRLGSPKVHLMNILCGIKLGLSFRTQLGIGHFFWSLLWGSLLMLHLSFFGSTQTWWESYLLTPSFHHLWNQDTVHAFRMTKIATALMRVCSDRIGPSRRSHEKPLAIGSKLAKNHLATYDECVLSLWSSMTEVECNPLSLSSLGVYWSPHP